MQEEKSVGDERGLQFPPCACAALRSVSRAVTQFYDLVLAPTGLKTTQFVALKSIMERGELAQCDYARIHTVSVETLSRRLGKLRTKGYIQLRTSRHNEHVYSLTEEGKKAFLRALPYWERAQNRLQAAVGQDDWNKILELASRLPKATLKAEKLRSRNLARELPGTVASPRLSVPDSAGEPGEPPGPC